MYGNAWKKLHKYLQKGSYTTDIELEIFHNVHVWLKYNLASSGTANTDERHYGNLLS